MLKTPLSATALIRTTVWARLVPSRLTGFGCGCQSTRVDPCPSTTPGPEPGREGYTQALCQHPQSPYRGGGYALCLPGRLPTPRREPRAALLTRWYVLGHVGSVKASRNQWLRIERLRCQSLGVASPTIDGSSRSDGCSSTAIFLRSPFPLD